MMVASFFNLKRYFILSFLDDLRLKKPYGTKNIDLAQDKICTTTYIDLAQRTFFNKQDRRLRICKMALYGLSCYLVKD